MEGNFRDLNPKFWFLDSTIFGSKSRWKVGNAIHVTVQKIFEIRPVEATLAATRKAHGLHIEHSMTCRA